MILATKQGQKGMAQPITNPSPNPSPGAAAGTPKSNRNGKARNRSLTPVKQTLGAALIDWLGKLTLSGGDLDGQPFTVWPWEARFLRGAFRRPGNAGLSCGRGQGKSAFVAALATAVVAPGGPLHGTRREVICVASSFLQSRIIFEDVLAYARGLGHDLADRSLWRLQNSQNVATLEPTFPIWLNIPLSKSSAFFKPLSICETLAVGMAIITP